jgi:uncharacterized membrane protein YdcZ (DUF606 family)
VIIAICSALAVGVGLVLVLNVAGSIRAQDQGNSESKLNSLEYIGWGGQFFEYMGTTIETYQAYGAPVRRDLSDTGPVTFAGPLRNLGAGWIFGWRNIDYLDTNPERALAGTGFPLAASTRCVFYDLEADFGFYGELVALTILVALSQIAFLGTVSRSGISLIGFAALTCLLMFWGYSHQLSLFMSNQAKWTFISFALGDILVHFSGVRATSDVRHMGGHAAGLKRRGFNPS